MMFQKLKKLKKKTFNIRSRRHSCLTKEGLIDKKRVLMVVLSDLTNNNLSTKTLRRTDPTR